MNAKRRLSSRKPSVQTHSVDRHHRSAGFTLVEILVVIVIIGILMGLAVPAIFSAVSTAKSTAMKMELNTIEAAIEKYQEKYGDYPPDFSDWAVVERHYRKLFPRATNDIQLLKGQICDAAGDIDPSKFDRSEVIPWVLRGYSSDPLHPFTGPGGPWIAGPAGDTVVGIQPQPDNGLFEFDPSRLDLKQVGAGYISESKVEKVAGNIPKRDFFLSYAASDQTPTPLVYFDSRTYENYSNYGFNGYGKLSTGAVRPYMANLPEPGTMKNTFMNPHSFQIISPGLDGNFGLLSKNLGTTITAYEEVANPNYPGNGITGNAVFFIYPTGKAMAVSKVSPPQNYEWGLLDSVSRYHEPSQFNAVDNAQQDNLTNFADGKLIDELQE